MSNLMSTDILALLELASTFVADKKDHRSYLHDVLNKAVDKDTHLVAADGHKLVKIVIKDFILELPERISVDSIKNAVKISDLSIIKASAIHPDIAYPNYERLIPEVFTHDTLPRINALYIGQMANAAGKCNKKLGGNKWYGLDFLSMDNNNGNVFGMEFKDGISAQFVIMPMRK